MSSSTATATGNDEGFNVPLKCTPEEYKHFVEPAMAEAQKSNYPSALDIVISGLNAHPASEGLLFLRAYFGYKLADNMSNELSSLPKPIDTLTNGALMIDGAATSQMLTKFDEIVRILGEADEAVNELLQVNPASQEVLGFKSYIEQKKQRLGQESMTVRATFMNSPNIAGNFCVGCRKSISFDTQKIVFRRTASSQLDVWHYSCYQQQTNTGKKNN
jgi:hypothetical protein